MVRNILGLARSIPEPHSPNLRLTCRDAGIARSWSVSSCSQLDPDCVFAGIPHLAVEEGLGVPPPARPDGRPQLPRRVHRVCSPRLCRLYGLHAQPHGRWSRTTAQKQLMTLMAACGVMRLVQER